MSSQIIFFEKNIVDYANLDSSATASENGTLAYLVQDRSNLDSWTTTTSNDAANTTFQMNIGDLRTISEIILVQHNFKNYQIQYFNGSAFVDFPTPIHPTNDTKLVTRFSFPGLMTNSILITIFGTQIPDAQKTLSQLIITNKIGQLTGWPVIKSPTISRNKNVSQMLSGKSNISIGVGSFKCELDVAILSNSDDLQIIENLYSTTLGFLVWLCGGDELQFSSKRKGYRLQDFFLMRAGNDYIPEWSQGLYKSGIVTKLQLVEVAS